MGFKYNFIRDVDRQLLVSGGMTYFIPGAASAFSNFGGGDFHFFLTAGKEIFERGHWLSASGFRIPSDSNFGTQLWYWSNQWDYEVVDHWYGLLGLNWFHWMKDAGNNFTDGITGLDLINLPTTGVAGTNVVTGVIGARWKPSGNVEVGGGFEAPLYEPHRHFAQSRLRGRDLPLLMLLVSVYLAVSISYSGLPGTRLRSRRPAR